MSTTRTYIDDTTVTMESSLEQNLGGIAAELDDLTGRLTRQLGEIACHLEDEDRVEIDDVRRLLVNLQATAFYLSGEAANVAAIRAKALGKVD